LASVPPGQLIDHAYFMKGFGRRLRQLPRGMK
jgi:hypothetical protein